MTTRSPRPPRRWTARRYHAPGRAALVLILVSAVLIGLLITQSLGDIASEPLGGGSNREFIIGLGRPLILLLVGVGAMLLLTWHWPHGGLTEEGWPGRAIARAAGLVLTVGAAAGLSKLAQETGMAEMNAERLLGWNPGPALVLVLPFAVAAIMKLLQGSSLVGGHHRGRHDDGTAGAARPRRCVGARICRARHRRRRHDRVAYQ